MSTERKSNLKHHELTESFGGRDYGVTLSISQVDSSYIPDPHDKSLGHLRLDMTEAATLAVELAKFVREEAMRRRDLLKEVLAQIKEDERTVWHEVRDMNLAQFENLALHASFVELLCPKVRNIVKVNDSEPV